MATSDHPDGRPGREFVDADLRGARFVGVDLTGAVMRGVDLAGADIDTPWLFDGDATLLVNGVDVTPFVAAELDRRFPGRADRRATDPEGLRAAWSVLQATWAATLERAAAMPAGTVEESVDGEWSLAQTLRHLVFATDVWLGQALLPPASPAFHPLGLPGAGTDPPEVVDLSGFVTGTPSYDDVLEARADRTTLVGALLATVTPEELAVARTNPWAPQHPETTRSCLHVVLEEEWEHLRFAVRDLDAIDARAGG